MRISLLVVGLAILPATGGCTQPAGMYQTAQVRLVDSRPCFAVADNDEARRTPPVLTAISVDRFTGADWTNVWRWITPVEPSVTLVPDQCIPFGSALVAGGSSNVVATLQPGERYGVSINSQIVNPESDGDPMVGRIYSQSFCLQSSSNGGLTVIEVPRVRGELKWGVCGPPAAGESDAGERVLREQDRLLPTMVSD